jgi:hypothetical protein
MKMIDLTPIVEGIITLAVALVTAFLIPYIKEKISEERYIELQTWVNVAVESAEMIYTGTGRGAEKKQYVLDFLDKKGYIIDFDSVEAMLEAAVHGLQEVGEKA